MEKMTKIIGTLSDRMCGPEFIRRLHEKGLDIIRINTAHATLENARRIVDNAREASEALEILIDTKGPEIRLTDTDIPDGIRVRKGDTMEFRNNAGFSSSYMYLNTNCSTFVDDVPVGARILVDDGTLEFMVVGKDSERLITRVMNSGVVRSRKNVNVPDVRISLPPLTDKDREFIRWAIDSRLDYIAHSFVRSADDLSEISSMLKYSDSRIRLIAKIENQQGIDNLSEILDHSHGIMIARGDLGVEVPVERLPVIQRQIVRKCNEKGKMVMIATQMLHTMIENPRPTRAEVTDVANAIFQGADAVMLSGETADGRYPEEAVDMMRRIITEVEYSGFYSR